MSYSHDNVIDKLIKLNERIAVDPFNDVQEKDLIWCQRLLTDVKESGGETKSDKTWVMEEITNLRQGGWLSATKMKVANEMWSKYGG